MMRTITPIFSIISALLVFFFFTKPIFVEIEQIQNETAQYEEAAARASELNAELSSKLTEKRSYSAESLERLEALVPNEVNEVKILHDLNERARAYNLLLGNVEVTDNIEMQTEEITTDVSYDTLKTKDIAFSLIGSYDQFKSFLTDLEQSLVMLEITNIKFTANDGFLQQYDITARAFALPTSEQ